MELAVIISLIALLVALPSCIADSLIVISKVRAYFKNRQRTYKKPLILSKLLSLLKKASPFHLQNGVRAACLTVLAVMLFALISIKVLAPSQNPEQPLTESHKDSITRQPRVYRGKGVTITVRCPEDTSSFSDYGLNDHVGLFNLTKSRSKSSCG